MQSNITEGIYIDDKGRKIIISQIDGSYYMQVDENISIRYRNKMNIIRDLKKMSKNYTKVEE